jgi:hypothetical protein
MAYLFGNYEVTSTNFSHPDITVGPWWVKTDMIADYEATMLGYLRLTDEEPITPDVLKRLGFSVVEKYDDGSGEHLKCGKLECVWEDCRKGPYIGWLTQIPLDLKPRTIGELRMIAMRLGQPLTE